MQRLKLFRFKFLSVQGVDHYSFKIKLSYVQYRCFKFEKKKFWVHGLTWISGGFRVFRTSCRVMKINVVNLETRRQPMVDQLLSISPLEGNQNDSVTLKIHPCCCDDSKMVKICVVVRASYSLLRILNQWIRSSIVKVIDQILGLRKFEWVETT